MKANKYVDSRKSWLKLPRKIEPAPSITLLKTNKNIFAQFRNCCIQLCRPFLVWWICWFHLSRTIFFWLRRLHFHFLWLLDKNHSYKKYLIHYCLEFGKNMGPPLLIFNIMYMIGYYNEFTFLQRQIIFQLFFKYNWVHNYIYHMINWLSMLMKLNVF